MIGRIFIDGLHGREILLPVEVLKHDLVVVEKNQAAADDPIAMDSGLIERFELRDILRGKRLRRHGSRRHQARKNRQ